MTGEFEPLRFNGVEDVLELHADAKRFHDELLDFVQQQPLPIAGAGRRARGDDGADSRLHFEPALLNQVLYDLVRRVGVDFQFGRERANGRKGLTRLKLTADKRLGRGKDDLVEDGDSRPERQPE